MRVFLLACLAAILLGTAAAYVLNAGYFPDTSSAVFSTQSVRLDRNS